MLVLAIFLVSVPIISHAAPHGATCHDSENCESSINQYQESSNAIEEILFDTIFNSTDNSRIVKRTFREQPGTHKICTLVAYNVTCDEDSDISPQCNESDPQCILGLYNILWTEFDSSDTAGTLLLYLASNGFSVLGFEWAGACDLLQDDSNAANLSLVLPSSLCNGNQSDIDLKEEIMLSLIYITTLVSFMIMPYMHRIINARNACNISRGRMNLVDWRKGILGRWRPGVGFCKLCFFFCL